MGLVGAAGAAPGAALSYFSTPNINTESATSANHPAKKPVPCRYEFSTVFRGYSFTNFFTTVRWAKRNSTTYTPAAKPATSTGASLALPATVRLSTLRPTASYTASA